jgi:hypothetical protein
MSDAAAVKVVLHRARLCPRNFQGPRELFALTCFDYESIALQTPLQQGPHAPARQV